MQDLNKLCKRCNSIRAKSFFNKNKSRKDGLQDRCKDCMRMFRFVKKNGRKPNPYGTSKSDLTRKDLNKASDKLREKKSKPKMQVHPTVKEEMEKCALKAGVACDTAIGKKDLEEAEKILKKKNPTSFDCARIAKIDDEGLLTKKLKQQMKEKKFERNNDLRLIAFMLFGLLLLILTQY